MSCFKCNTALGKPDENLSCSSCKETFHISCSGVEVSTLCHIFSTGKLKQGVTFERILDDVRDNIDGQLQRIHLLTRKDLHNIARDCNILNYTKLHNDDATSVKLWVHAMSEAGEDSPVIYYKEQGEEDPLGKLEKQDFQLVIMTKFQKNMLLKFGHDKVCIDSTHGTNSYSFQLTTILVIDEFGAGCPVGFCISNRVDETALKIFFEAVKEKACSIACKTFMTDDAPAFHNAWVPVMGPPLHHLLCTWHVDRSWRKNLSKISGSKEKKALVYKALRIILQERDIDKFNVLLQNFMLQVEEDEETKLFGSYFKSYYSNRTEVWAFCHRPRLGINTNMHLESMHKTLKHFYLEGKKAKRLDKTINMIMKLSRDKIFDRLIKFTKNVPSEKIKKIRNSHQLGVVIDKSFIMQVNDSEWTVLSANKDKSYTVHRNEDISCKNCFFSCRECNICVHMYECTCMDNFIHFNICKHIHACVELKGSSTKLEDTNINEEIDSILDSCLTQNSLTKTTQSSCLASLKQKAHLVCNLLENSGDLDEKSSSALSNLLDKELAILRGLKSSSFKDEAPSEPPNKKIKLQPRFYSTKKTSNKKDGISKPSANEELERIYFNESNKRLIKERDTCRASSALASDDSVFTIRVLPHKVT